MLRLTPLDGLVYNERALFQGLLCVASNYAPMVYISIAAGLDLRIPIISFGEYKTT
jgi:hypothetical protein